LATPELRIAAVEDRRTERSSERATMQQYLPLFAVAVAAALSTQLTAAEIAPIKRVLPPEGIEIPADVRERLETKLAAAKQRLENLHRQDQPDVEIFTKAVELALLHREFYTPKDFAKADLALEEATKRLDLLQREESPWRRATGLSVRGYRSSIDGSAQPYGLVVPKDHDFTKPCPLYVWLHGRGDKNTDLHFLYERATKVGQIAPPNAIVVHPFGRHCVGFKHAGEMDVLEAAAHVASECNVERGRFVLVGFSMGGAGAWHIGAHYSDRWLAVAPGAGFAETARYQRLTPDKFPPQYEQQLWGAYDVPNYVRNLFNTRVITYSGELDKQIQAARVMEEAYQAEGRELEHLIGPGVEHKYEPKTLEKLMHRLNTAVTLTDRRDIAVPNEIHLQTRTLRYARTKWLAADGLEEHWQDARIDGQRHENGNVQLNTKNISRIRVEAFLERQPLTIDGQQLQGSRGVLVKDSGKWRWGTSDEQVHGQLRKSPGLQGPIDDAFLERFVVIEPTGKSRHPKFQAWCDFELAHFKSRWQALMRGELPVKRDVDVSRDELDQLGNVVLFGDGDSNAVIKQLADDLPVKFREGSWSLGGAEFDGGRFVPAFVFPRKSSRGDYHRYIVLNSGLTFREGHDRTNSLQNPKLPDWAIIDISQPPDALAPGRIHDAGFFDEAWQFRGSVKGPTP
jgi:predicted esterase